MFQILLTIAAIIAIYRVAEADRGEGFKWSGIMLGLCVLSFFIPLPFISTLLAIGIVFGLMTFTKKTFY